MSSPSHTQTFTPDALGNFSGVNTDGTNVTRTHNQQNEVTGVGANTLAFDKNGNMTTDEQGRTLVYDAWNRLVAVKNGGTTLASYKFDGTGRRIVETAGNNTRDLYFDGWNVVEERLNGATTADIQYIWSPVYVNALILRDRSTAHNGTLDERLWVQQDANWNVTALINGSGTVVERYDYDPYGVVTYLNATWGSLSSSAYAANYLFQSERLDPATNYYHMEERDYSATLQRFVGADPTGFSAGDNHFYRFVGNSPVDNTDPTGLMMAMALRGSGGTLVINPSTGQVTFMRPSTGGSGQPDEGDWLDMTGNAIAGFNDTWTFGLTKRFRKATGMNDFVNENTGFYQGGQVAGEVYNTAWSCVTPCGQTVNWATKTFRGISYARAGANVLNAGDNLADGNYMGAVGDMQGAFSSLSQARGPCFVAGTPLLTPDGSKAIEKFVAGDWILAAPDDDASAAPAYRQVEEVFVRVAPILKLRVGSVIIQTTAEHPFWVDGRGWVGAGLLIEGDRLRSHDGAWIVVGSVQDTGRVQTVYNLRVTEYHTYFVGAEDWGFSIWAHNADYPKSPTGKGSVPPDQRDPKRVWTKPENQKKLGEQNGNCASCDQPTTIDNGRGHHRTRHADGGLTVDSNHDILCVDCHKEVHR